MGRYGFAPGEAVEIIGGLGRDAAHLEGLMSHYSVSDSGKPADQEFTQQQTRRLRIIANANKSMGLSFFTHAANSGAVLHHPDAHFDAVRPGVMLYGTHPDPAVVDETLRQVMSLKTRVVSIHPHAAGDPIGYGRTYTMPHDGRVGLLPIGYGDGLPRSLGNRARVLIRGKRVPIIGRVCMDQVMIDLTGVDGVEVGEEVVLYGAQGSERIGIEEAASIAGTITYEITCQVGKRVPRRWLNPSPSSVG
jgi:alanine racemase